jgi:hypothetical protein
MRTTLTRLMLLVAMLTTSFALVAPAADAADSCTVRGTNGEDSIAIYNEGVATTSVVTEIAVYTNKKQTVCSYDKADSIYYYASHDGRSIVKTGDGSDSIYACNYSKEDINGGNGSDTAYYEPGLDTVRNATAIPCS